MNLYAELKRRNVFRVAAAYIVVGWLLLQVASVMLGFIAAPAWIGKALIALLVLGFMPSLAVAWIFEVGPQGLQRDDGQVHAENGKHARRLDLVTLAAVVCVAGLVFWEHLRLPKPENGPDTGSATVSGARSVAQAVPSGREIDAAPDSAADPVSAPRNSIAVLPFVDLSAERDQAYFGDGLAEELLNVLAQVDGLAVASRTSSFAFKDKALAVPEIAASLGVAHIVEGSVRKAGTRLRITAQLIDVSSDRHLWSQTFDRELTDVFAIQDEIARAIADALRVTLGVEANAAAGTRDVAAYDLYLLGMYHWHQRTPQALNQALAIFQQAIARDPTFARAEAGLAMTYVVLAGYADVDADEATRSALAHARRAVQLDPDSHEAQTALGGVLGLNLFQRQEALAALTRAIEINPRFATAHHWKGLVLTQNDEVLAGEAALRTAHALDPASLPAQNYLAINLSKQGRHEEALALNQALLQRAPDYRNALFDAFRNACRLGRAREFEDHLARYLAVIGEDPAWGPPIVAGIVDPAQRDTAIALVEGFAPRHRQGGKADQIAVLFALLGARAQTLVQLHATNRDFDYLDSLDFLRGDPEFEAWRAGIEAQRQAKRP